MSEWQPIETAPVGKVVRYGYWEEGYLTADDRLIWRTECGAVWVRGLFGRVKRSSDYRADKATHWKPLPEPPNSGAAS